MEHFKQHFSDNIRDVIYTREYTRLGLLALLQPYIDEFTRMNSIEDVINWGPVTIPELIGNDNVPFIEHVRQGRHEYIGKIAISYIHLLVKILLPNIQYVGFPAGFDAVNHLSTPWDLLHQYSFEGHRLFGNFNLSQARFTTILNQNEMDVNKGLESANENTLLVNIRTPDNIFYHSLTEECVFGILTGLNIHPDLPENTNVKIYLGDVKIPFSHLHERYQHLPDLPYTCLINNIYTISFKSEEFIRGINTACLWSGKNPSEVISDIRLITNNVPLTIS